MRELKIPAPVYALASAFLFAAGMPSAKVLVAHTDPTMLAGLLYLGSGSGLSLILILRRMGKQLPADRTVFDKADFGWLAGSTMIGGVLAPLSLMVAMSAAAASAVSLLLNFEIIFTAFIAWLIFKERLSVRVMIGLAAIFLGGVCLSGGGGITASWSLLPAVGAALFWSIDSNLAGQISHASPVQIARFKGLTAGTINLSLALFMGSRLPDWNVIAGAAITGVFCYGISQSMFIAAIRGLGAARAVAYIATEPFVAAILSIVLLKETVSYSLVMAGILMSAGVWLHLTEKHEHMQAVLETGVSAEP